jgi:4-azaleucine resistance transporter AzlC
VGLREFREGVVTIAPVLVAVVPIGLLWGTLAAAKGLSPLEAGLMSATVFAGAAQYVAIELRSEPANWLMLGATAFVVNVRHVLMGASLARHLNAIARRWRPLLMYMMADENWAFSERRALTRPLTLGYYLGLALPMVTVWALSSLAGALAGRSLGDPAVIGFDFAFSAIFIALLAGFWKGPRTAAILGASAAAAVFAKLLVAGAWYIVIGGLAGVAAAAVLGEERA